MAGKQRRASGFSANIGKFVAEERAKRKDDDSGKPWSMQRLADEMNRALEERHWGEWKVTRTDVLRIERGEQEIRGSQLYALGKALDLPIEDLMDPDAARSRKLADYKVSIREARDAAWRACAAIYHEGRKSETALNRPGYLRAFTEAFEELPPSSDAPPAAAPAIREALQNLAWLGVDHRERSVKLTDRAAALEQELSNMTRFRADYLELLMDKPEYDARLEATEAALEETRQQRAAADEYKRGLKRRAEGQS